MPIVRFISKLFFWGATTAFCLTLLTVAGLSLYLNPKLPSVDSLRSIQLQTPLQIYSADRKLIAEFGEKRRKPINIENVPSLFVKAILAAEDDRFEKHHGVDIKGLIRASMQLVTTGSIQTGGSTITMQVAKNYFLSRERTFSRKFNEILLALQIEQELTKREILELYVNKIYLGNRAYGIQAASFVYYGKDISELNLAQLAMIAGLPKAPSSYNPLANAERALLRRNWILQRMRKLNYIDQQSYEEAKEQTLSAAYHGLVPELEAPYVAEMVRTELLNKYSPEILYTSGLKVFTSIDSRLQESANNAVTKGLLAYDRRHGYRGAEQSILLDIETPLQSARQALDSLFPIGPLLPAVVLEVYQDRVLALIAPDKQIEINWDGLKWARPYLSNNAMGSKPQSAYDIVKMGDTIRVLEVAKSQWSLAQIPVAQSAFVSFDPRNGALLALVGGFDFQHSKFNRATQAARQPGSNFKPFIYAAALENGFTAASMINDAPVVFEDELLESSWRPENYSGKFFGPTRLRKALYKSRNLVSIRLLNAIGIKQAINYVERFGFDSKKLPKDLSLALGSAEFTPFEIAAGYAVFANGGYKIEPYVIASVESHEGETLFRASPKTVCRNCQNDSGEKAIARIDRERLLANALQQEIGELAMSTARPDIPKPENHYPANEDKFVRQNTQTESVQNAVPAIQVMDARVAYIINSILKDVIQIGTGRRARTLGRHDLAGKTGTTNDQKDAWFSGFNQDIVATVWVGFDQPQTLGKREVGGYAALPIWIDFMEEALTGKAETALDRPDQLITVRIDPVTGLLARPGQTDAIFEIFRQEYAPKQTSRSPGSVSDRADNQEKTPEQLF